jgi:hypothetical protein
MSLPLAGAPWRTVSLYGLTLRSDFPFATALPDVSAPADLTFRCLPGPPPPLPPRAELACPSALSRSGLEVYRDPGGLTLRFPTLADFTTRPGEITAWVRDDTRADLLEIRLLGTVLSLVLESQGLVALHASAVEVAAGAVAFLANKRSGKTWLALACLRAGHRLVSDDILPVERTPDGFLAQPAIPEMRLEPADLEGLGLSREGLRPVLDGGVKLRVPLSAGEPGRFCPAPLPLRRVYLPRLVPDAPGAAPRMLALAASQALVELVRTSFSARLVGALGWQPERLGLFAELVLKVPCRVLELPRGARHLPAAVDAIRRDVEAGGDDT